MSSSGSGGSAASTSTSTSTSASASTSTSTSAASNKDEAPPAGNPPKQPLPPLPDPLPGKHTDITAAIGTAWRGAIGNVTGDKKNEIVVVDSKAMRVLDASGKELASMPVTAGIDVLAIADVDGDGHAEILAGWGMSRDFRDAKARVTLYRVQSSKLVEELVVAPETSRDEVVAVQAVDKNTLLVAYYDSKFMVTSAYAKKTDKGWTLDKLASIRMANAYGRGDVDGDGKPDVVVGRMYGDDKGVDGDAFVLGDGGTRTPIPTTRGLRSLAVVGSDIFFGDGWHQNYGEHARGFLSWAKHDKDGFHTTRIEDTPGQYAIERIVPATIAGKPALVTLGSNYVRVYSRTGDTWHGLTVAGIARDVAVGDLDGKPGDEILVIGDKSEIVDLSGATWPSG
jgi:hypothetical protein